jgi:N6-L-threonylcarbamoyladenine synthase
MRQPYTILGIETSCDDTSAAVIDSNYKVYSNCISSQLEHEEFGGVVPELASRLHLKNIMWLTRLALDQSGMKLQDLDAIAVSINPGLIGSLLVGVSFAKGLAYSAGKPLIAVNHMVGHLYAIKLDYPGLEPPYLALIASGGHTELIYFTKSREYETIGRTRDDAAGEAFDKAAKLMGLGYPGGPVIDKLARGGRPDYVNFPRGLDRKGDYDFSYSGLKTAIRNYVKNTEPHVLESRKQDIAASIQASIIDIMVKKTVAYALEKEIGVIVVAGGVAANSYLRIKLKQEAVKMQIDVYFPSVKYCMDNAAMIGAAAIDKYAAQEFSGYDLNAFSTKGLRFV